MAEPSAWERYIREGRDRTQATQRQIQAFVNNMVRDGQLRAGEAQKAIDDIQGRLAKQLADTQKRVRETIRDELKRIGVATKSDLDRLERKVARLEKQIATQKASKSAPAKAASKSAAKKSPAKKSAAKRSA
ncbi:MAG: phasin family protein [Acidimicrobiia bacterium]|nr:phasin family protein [Acidimicrobiia bacterium]